MRRILFFISVLFSVLISCSDDIQKYDADVYENAVKYLSQNMNKYVKNNIISQKWENDNLHFRLKSDTIFKSCLLYTSPSPRDNRVSRMPSSA